MKNIIKIVSILMFIPYFTTLYAMDHRCPTSGMVRDLKLKNYQTLDADYFMFFSDEFDYNGQKWALMYYVHMNYDSKNTQMIAAAQEKFRKSYLLREPQFKVEDRFYLCTYNMPAEKDMIKTFTWH